MKFFFLASVASNTELEAIYRRIIRELRKHGHKVIYKHVFEKPKEVESLSSEKLKTRAEKLSQEMLQCDGVVYEGTFPSTGCGYLLSRALQKNIPSLFLSQSKYSGLYLADPNRLLMIKQYDTENCKILSTIIKKFLGFVPKKRLSDRFNLMVSNSMYDFINIQSKKQNISKAEYIRNLVYQQMRKKNKNK